MKIRFTAGVVATALAALSAAFPLSVQAADKLTKVRMSVDEDPIVLRLADSLGYFKQEGIEIERLKLEDLSGEDYLMQGPLIKGQIDASYHWFNHAVFGARHNLPIKGVMVFDDAPWMTIMVANRVKDQIKSAADFKGRNVAEGAGYGTKSIITNYLTTKAGLPLHSFTPVMVESEGRQQAVINGLKEGKVDVMTFQEPISSALQETGLVTTLYDLNTRESTTKVLGAPWPAQSLLMAPAYIKAHPDTAQHLIDALVRTMRFINGHSPAEVIAKLPDSYYDGKDKATTIKYLKNTMPALAKGDYSFSPASVRLVLDSVQRFDFDKSQEGIWRATVENPKKINPDELYDNRFVKKAMQEIK